MATFHENLKSFRNKMGLTQQQVSEYLTIDRGAYANYEAGRDMPFEFVEKVCTLFGVSMAAFYDDKVKILEEEMICSFRTQELSEQNIREVARFKNIVRNYLKMTSLTHE